LLHDNAPAHNSASFCQVLKKKNVTTIYHVPYYAVLSPTVYFLFPKLKIILKGLHFADVVEIKEAVTGELKKSQEDEFSAAFQKVCDRAKAYICVYANGVYSE